MDQIINGIWNTWNQPQLLSLFVTVLVCIIISLVVYFKVKKVKPDQAPKGVALIAEAYVKGIDSQYENTAGEKLPKAKVYIFTLGTFLFIGNWVVILGLEPVVTSYSVTLTLGLSTFLGIYVVKIVYQKWHMLKNYMNPMNIIGDFSPLISISFRIYGNIIGGATLMFLIYSVCGYVWTLIPGMSNHEWYFFAPFITPLLHLYFDLFGGLIQAYVFSLLTTIYWVSEAVTPEKKTRKNKKIINANSQLY